MPACEIAPDGGGQCKEPTVAYVMGKWACRGHMPKPRVLPELLDTAGDPIEWVRCTHDAAPSGRCSYCGTVVERPD